MMLTLAAMNLAIRLPGFRHQNLVSVLIGLLFAAMVLTKTSAAFLLPALVSIFVVAFWRERRKLVRLLVVSGAASMFGIALWMLSIISNGLYGDFKYFFTVNNYPKRPGLLGELTSLWITCRGITQPDRIFISLSALLFFGACIDRFRATSLRPNWAERLWRDPLFFGCIFAISGYIIFMTYQNHPQSRYYVVIAFFSFCLLAQTIAQLLDDPGRSRSINPHKIGHAALATVVIAIAVNGIWTLKYVFHPQYTWIDAAKHMTQFMDQHPNGNRLLLATSGDEITLITHVPSICDIWGTEKLSTKIARYQPGWYATWDRLDPINLREIHSGFSLEQVAEFPAFGDPGHSVLYLFKLNPLPNGQVRTDEFPSPLPGDKISIPVI